MAHQTHPTQLETDVLVIGGGATGAGLAWDLALRGIRTMLVEMGDLATGTSGRYHGLLHSGGRYAVRDPESAKECIDENLILRRIAPHALEDTGGLFILCPDDDVSYVDQWLKGCAAAGIPTHEISVSEALRREPKINPRIRAAYEVPDGTCDSWDLVHAVEAAATEAGARFLTYHRVDDFTVENGRVVAAHVTDLRRSTPVTINFQFAINAAGPWAWVLAEKIGAHFKMKLSRGAMLAFTMRWVNTVVNRLRLPGDGDIFVPVGTVSVAGTTSVRTDDPADVRVEPWEVERILTETDIMTPGISRARVLRAWGGVRPLYDASNTSDGRGAARTFTLLDHAEADGIAGMVSIIGGKLTTFRQMAEKTVDFVAAKLGVTAPCVTATTPIPPLHAAPPAHPEHPQRRDKPAAQTDKAQSASEQARLRAGAAADGGAFHALRNRLDALEHGATPGPLICECELITAPQIADALASGSVFSLHDLRRDLRLGMGPCQGGFCAWRAAALRHDLLHDQPAHTDALLTEFVERRFGGVKPLLWAHNLRQALLAEHIYGRMVGIHTAQPTQTVPVIAARRADRGGGERRTDNGAAGSGQTNGVPRVVVVGAGLAGLMSALAAVEAGYRVELVAFGQGALVVHPGWIECGDVDALERREGHPYATSADALGDGLALLDSVVPLTASPLAGQPLHALTALGTFRAVSYAAGGALHELTTARRVAVVGLVDWRDFYSSVIADHLRAQGYDAHAFDIRLHDRIGNFDAWPVDVANLLDTPDGLRLLVEQVKPQLDGARAAAFPAVLGFRAETRARIADALGVPVLEVPTLPPSVPGLRLYNALRGALLERGGRVTMGTRVSGMNWHDGRVTGVQAMTAANRPRVIGADAVILATGGLYGGGVESDYQRRLSEPILGLPVAHTPADDWFTQPFLSGAAQPIHHAGVATDLHLRPYNADGAVYADNLFAAGRILAGFSPVADGCTEGVDIATALRAVEGVQTLVAAARA